MQDANTDEVCVCVCVCVCVRHFLIFQVSLCVNQQQMSINVASDTDMFGFITSHPSTSSTVTSEQK